MIKFNINSYVKVRLTAHGKKELKRQHKARNKRWKSNDEYEPPETDEKGYSKFLMHELMHLFGPELFCGNIIPFETTILIDEKDLKP